MSSRRNSSPGDATPFSHSGFQRPQVCVDKYTQITQETITKTVHSVNADGQGLSNVPTKLTGHRNDVTLSEFIEAEAENASFAPVTQNGCQHISRLGQTPVHLKTHPGNMFSQTVGGSTHASTQNNHPQVVNGKSCDFQLNFHQNPFGSEFMGGTQAVQTSPFVQEELPSSSSALEKLHHRRTDSQFVDISNFPPVTIPQNILQNNRPFAAKHVPFVQETVEQNERFDDPQNCSKQNVLHDNVVRIFKTAQENENNSPESLGSATARIIDKAKKTTECLIKHKSSSSEQDLGNTFAQNDDISTQSLPIMRENTTQTSNFVKIEEMPIEQTAENGHQSHVQFVNTFENASQEGAKTSQFVQAKAEDVSIELSNKLVQNETNQVQEFTSSAQKAENVFSHNDNHLNRSLPTNQDNATQTSNFVIKLEKTPIEPKPENKDQKHSQFNEVQVETSQFVRADTEVSIELSNRCVQTETNQEQTFENMFLQNKDIPNQSVPNKENTTQTSNVEEKVEEMPIEPTDESGHQTHPHCVSTNNDIQKILNVSQLNQEFTISENANKQNNKRKSQEMSNPPGPSNNAKTVEENLTKNCTFVNMKSLERHKSSSNSSKSPDFSEHLHKDGSFLVTHHSTFNSIQVKHSLHFDWSGGEADFGAYYAKILNTLENATRKSLVYAKRGDKIQLELRNPNFRNTVSVILRELEDKSCLNVLLDRLGEANAEANTSVNQLEMVVQIVQVHAGGGKRKCEELEDLIKRKRKYLYVVRNNDNQLCFAISLAYILNPGLSDCEAMRLGAQLQDKAGLTDQTPVTFGDVTKFETLINRKIIVFYREENANTLNTFMTSFERTDAPPVYLYLQDSHYVGIWNVQAFIGKKFCEHCFQTYDSLKTHYCAKHCSICLDPGCEKNEAMRLICQECHHKCRSCYCYKAHKKPRWHPNAKVNASECDRRKKCRICKITFLIPLANIAKNQPFEHKCPGKLCSTCGDKLDKGEHECYILPLDGVQIKRETNLIFYEFKTYITDIGKHVPFVLSTKTLQGKTWTAYGERCIVEFLLHFKSKAFSGTTFISHHADSSVLLVNMAEIGENTNVIMQGSKIVCIELPDRKQKFVDAALFLQMPLAALPETFGFSTYKGFFPVLFISKENLQYVGKCPAPEFYAVELTNDKKRQDFEEAYELARIGEFNFKREAQIYCEDDVDILTTACVKLRTLFINRYNVDPFSCTSLQTFGMSVFCTKFLAPTMLAIPPFDDYKANRKMFTDASIEWLEWVMFSEKIFIQHALNKGAKQLKKCVYVDGYSEANGQKVVWEFVRCAQNVCPLCFPSMDQGARHRISEEKLEKLSLLRNVKLIVMREHNWNIMKQFDAKIKAFLKRYESPQRLTLHELANGNLSGVVKLRHSAGPDEEIRFAQVNSLFPYVVATQSYPIGHPQRIFEKFDDLQSYFGLIKAVVYPPRELFLPFLPYKTANGTTVFTLCRTCYNLNNQQGACGHNDDERALTGVWVTPELNKALQLGYKIGKIMEVWHFEQKSNTIFEEFVSDFIRGKQESLGFHSKPANLAKTYIYKRCLEEFWKGFGDRNPQLKTKIMTKNSDFVKLMFSNEFEVEYFKIVSIKTALVQWTQAKSPPKKTDNVFITAFTAAYARLHLYNILEKLQEKVLYFDTDRVVYVTKGGQNELEFGEGLGQLTDKLAGESVQEFASTGLKSYAYQTKTKQVVMNVKGITQTLENCEKINFSVKDVVKGFGSNAGEHEREVIKLDLKSVYDQRRLIPNGKTLPFGH